METKKKDIESGIELTKPKTEFEQNKTPSVSNAKDITNALLHPQKRIHTICAQIHSIQHCICNCLHNEWIWRLSPCLIIGSACYYLISRIDILEEKIEDLFQKDI